MRTRSRSTLARLVTVSVLGLAACGGGGGGGSGGGGGGGALTVLVETEPNGSMANAMAMTLGRGASGSLDNTGDVDFWSIALTAGQIISIELLATRLDQTHWDDNLGKNLPRLTLFDVDGTSKLLEHDFSGNTSAGWDWGRHDLDIPLFRVPATGTYFVSARQDNTATDGGDYVLTVSTRTLAGFQTELEASGTSGVNETTGASQAIVPGNVHGFFVDGETDAYSFDVAAASIVRFELTAYRNGVFHGDDDYFDGRLSLIDSNGATQLAANNDAFFSDPAIHFRIDTPGTYFIVLEEQVGSGDGEYFLSYTNSDATNLTAEVESNDSSGTAQLLSYGATVEATANTGDDDFYTFNGTAGDLVRAQCFHSGNWREAASTVAVEALDSNGATPLLVDAEGNLHVQSILLRHDGVYFLRVPAAGSATPYTLRLERFLSSTWETEDNDAIARANPLDAGGRAAGVVIDNNDDDFFSFAGTAGVPITIQLYAAKSLHSDGFFEYSGYGSALLPRLRLLNSSGGTICESHSGKVVGTEGVIAGLPTGAAAFVPAVTGTFYARVESVNNLGQADYHYVIEKR
ncbi:MAG TPA: hypothetical protein VK843_17395 [Planctomycetota bacterium]|nr:hypothetical protein [Planctomycetota bacterium]